MTNFEKIKAMTIEEMAKFLNASVSIDYCKMCETHCEYDIGKFTSCEYAIRNWLESEAENEH